MHFEGIIKTWDEARGCGFIEPLHGGQQVFVHITALPARSGRPALKQRVSFEVELDHEGKKRAKNVRPALSPRTARQRSPGASSRWGAAALFTVPLFALLFFAAGTLWHVPPAVGGAYVALSVLCCFMYAQDRAAAVKGRRRTPQIVLLSVGLLGGWPGAVMAQQFLPHKSATTAFRSAFWGTVVLNLLAFIALSSPSMGSWRWLG